MRKRTKARFMLWRWLASLVILGAVTSPSNAGPINLDTWYQFSFSEAGFAAGCDPQDPAGGFCVPSSGTPTSPLDAPPWTFTVPVTGSLFTVTDLFEPGDRFEVFDFGTSLGVTSLPGSGDSCGDDPVPCLAISAISKATFQLAAGDHSITIAILSAPSGGGSGSLIAAPIPEPGTWVFLSIGLGLISLCGRKRFRLGVRN